MARADLLKKLFSSFKQEDKDSFYKVASEIIEDERKKNHGILADDLRMILNGNYQPKRSMSSFSSNTPKDSDKEIPLVEVIYPEKYFSDLIITDEKTMQLDQIIKEFQDIGANTECIEVHSNYMTPSSYIIANQSKGSRTIITSKKEPIRKLDHDGNIHADLILVDGEHPETAEAVLRANPNAISVIDAGRLTDDTKRLGKLVTYVVCSKVFAESFADRKIDVLDKDSLIYCYEKLREYFQTNIIITLEDKGSFTKIDDYEILPTVKVVAVDSTGAGDIFHGAFTYFIGNGYSLRDAIHYASITSAISVTRVGARISIPELSEVLEYDELI